MINTKKKSMKWAFIAIAIAVIAAISIWTILSRQANQNRSYSGAQFIEHRSVSMEHGGK